MRKRFNRNAVCSSENYSASRHAHLELLKEKHDHFCGFMVSGEMEIDIPKVDSKGMVLPKFKTLRIWGKDIRVTIEEYNTFMATCK
jgi:hypothetical protein